MIGKFSKKGGGNQDKIKDILLINVVYFLGRVFDSLILPEKYAGQREFLKE